MLERIAKASPLLKAKIAGVFYLLTIVGGMIALFIHGRLGSAADLIAGVSYMAVTLLFYDIFRPVNRSLSLLAALFSIAGFATGRFGLHPREVDISMVFFGCYCVLIGYLIVRSTFLPRILGGLMMFAGLSWLTFLSPRFANYLSPYNMVAGGVVELSLCLWLLVMGLNVSKWRERANAAAGLRS